MSYDDNIELCIEVHDKCVRPVCSVEFIKTIMLQNLEPSTISRQYATLLLDAALEQCKWELSKDLVRFLRAIGKLTVLHKMYLINTLYFL